VLLPCHGLTPPPSAVPHPNRTLPESLTTIANIVTLPLTLTNTTVSSDAHHRELTSALPIWLYLRLSLCSCYGCLTSVVLQLWAAFLPFSSPPPLASLMLNCPPFAAGLPAARDDFLLF
jgi:hypothetical protein